MIRNQNGQTIEIIEQIPYQDNTIILCKILDGNGAFDGMFYATFENTPKTELFGESDYMLIHHNTKDGALDMAISLLDGTLNLEENIVGIFKKNPDGSLDLDESGN